jgi:hypothetical protein
VVQEVQVLEERGYLASACKLQALDGTPKDIRELSLPKAVVLLAAKKPLPATLQAVLKPDTLTLQLPEQQPPAPAAPRVPAPAAPRAPDDAPPVPPVADDAPAPAPPAPRAGRGR